VDEGTIVEWESCQENGRPDEPGLPFSFPPDDKSGMMLLQDKYRVEGAGLPIASLCPVTARSTNPARSSRSA
jgi:hypothetical protein